MANVGADVQNQVADAHIPGVAIAVVEGGADVHTAGFGDDGHGNAITADDLGLDTAGEEAETFNLRQVREDAEKQAVPKVMARCDGCCGSPFR